MERNHYFRIGRTVAGNMPGKSMNIRHILNLILQNGSSADAFSYRNMYAGRFALEWADYQLIPADQIEPCPVQIRKAIHQQSGKIAACRNIP